MSSGVRGYLAGVCHGAAAVWVVGYVLYKSSVSLPDLFDPRSGVLPVVLAMPLAAFGNGLLMWKLGSRAAERPTEE